MPRREATGTRGLWLDSGLLALAVLAVWSFGLDGVFLLDDYPAIVHNPALRESWPPLAAMFPPPEIPGAGRPLVGLSLALNRTLGGLDVRGYHWFNIGVHLLATWLLYGCLRRGLPRVSPLWPARALALATALLWSLHPLQTEPVLYILQRSTLMMGACLLATLWCLLRALDEPSRERGWLATGVAACAAGMACKEEMVAAPLLMLLFDRTFVAGGFGPALRARPRFYAGLAGCWALLALLVVTGPDYGAMGMGLNVEIGPWTYMLNQPDILLGYVRRVVWPHPLILDYGQALPLSIADVVPQFSLVAVGAAATLVAVARRHPLGFAGAWFFLLLAPTSSVVPVASEVGAERRMYLPLAAAILLLVLLAGRLLRGAGRGLPARSDRLSALGPAGAAVLVTAAALCATGTLLRAADYRDAGRMWRSVADARPGWRAEHNLGVLALAAGETAAALPHFERAAELGPSLPQPADGLGVALMRLGRTEQARAALHEALRRDPDHAPAHVSLGVLELELRRYDEALRHLRRAVELQPQDADARGKLGAALHGAGRLDEAIAAYRRALELDPGQADAWVNLGVALDALGRSGEALAALERALGLRPDDSLARSHLERIRQNAR